MSIRHLGFVICVSFGLLLLSSSSAYAENLVQALQQVNEEQPTASEPPISENTQAIAVNKPQPVAIQQQIAVPKQPPAANKKEEMPLADAATEDSHLDYHDNKPHAVYITLADAIAISLRKNPAIEQAYLQRINQKFSFKIAQGQFEIQPVLTGTYKSKLESPLGNQQASAISPGLTLNTPFGTQFAFAWNNAFGRRFQSSTKTLTITQPLLQGIGTDVNDIKLENAADQEILNKLGLKQTIITTITTIISDYRTLQEAEMNFLNDEAALKISQKTIADTQKRIKAGVAAPSDIYQFQSETATNQLTIQSDLDTLQQNKIKLANDLGVNPNTDLIATITISTPDVVPDLELSQQLALLNDQTYLTDLINIRLAKRAMLLARDSARWQLNLTASASRASYGHASADGLAPTTPSGPADQNDTVGLSLTVPLGTAKLQNTANIVSAKISYQDDLITLGNDKRKLINNVQQQIETINIDIKKLQIAKQAVEFQKRTLETTTKKVNAGLSSGLELTTEQQNLRTTNQNLIQAKIAYLNDLSAFDQTVGTTLDTWKIKVHY